MPPLTSDTKVRSRSRDVVTQIEEKLKTDLPREILEATRSSLRVSKLRNRIGCFGKYDNERKRGCALLEYEVRDYNIKNDIRIDIPMERLAKAAFMKLKDFRDFHDMIGNFRESLRTDSTTPKTKKNIKSDTKNDEIESRTASIVNSESGIRLHKSSISSLAIQLGAFVPNSSGVALRATNFFREVVELLQESSKKGSIYGLRDVQNNQSSYEAACFYLIATSGHKKQNNDSFQRSSRKCYNGDENQELDLITFMNLTNVSSKFQMILDYVNELRNEIETKRSTNHSTSVESTSDGTVYPSSNISQKSNSVDSRKRRRKDIYPKKNNENLNDEKSGRTTDVDTSSFFRTDIQKNGESSDQNFECQGYYSNKTFAEWKSKTLREAYGDRRRKMNAIDLAELERGEKTGTSFEREDALDFVTREILSRNGLL
mmetsp:Transcript_22270/g.52940  ORF Transcript_22270/g.52940 Transcript_22270/m.52940 type:complete len:430 (-) Transcript_22270:359-1648(-)|eukprot:CAMPEP_0197199822 /NCGR_PEP_ID=MMETSP1423-20130617/34083_1 /TAXON_ID=476441 /ORGANISM="Pseudo-nitzschia heimii, Strain UNC1101" /LENGTH=429 /DNA_ID=CAMNT_0042653689 /DNA_START=70 /DNA_END=1359 /DNA_ORIENTATION=+